MRTITKLFAGAAGLTAFAAAAPAAAQYYPYGYGYQTYSPYGYNTYAVNANVAAQQCTAAVQNRLYNRTDLGQILGSLIGLPTAPQGRVVGITSQTQTRNGMRIRGVASSGRYAYNGYSPYGIGAYGSLGYSTAQTADLSFKCDVDYRGYVRDVDINRRY